jgi:hypothetical protein
MNRALETLLVAVYGAGIGALGWAFVWALAGFSIWQWMFFGAAGSGWAFVFLSTWKK